VANPFSALLGRLRIADGAPALPSSVHAERALELVANGATLLDVRESGEWRAGHAPRAIHIPLSQVTSRMGRLASDKPVVVMCASGSRSRLAAGRLRKAGFRATSLAGGIGAWQAAGGSVRSGR
jgi:rhodanese-related sulfurtransferase